MTHFHDYYVNKESNLIFIYVIHLIQNICKQDTEQTVVISTEFYFLCKADPWTQGLGVPTLPCNKKKSMYLMVTQKLNYV